MQKRKDLEAKLENGNAKFGAAKTQKCGKRKDLGLLPR
jgi:hypothetical protein